IELLLCRFSCLADNSSGVLRVCPSWSFDLDVQRGPFRRYCAVEIRESDGEPSVFEIHNLRNVRSGFARGAEDPAAGSFHPRIDRDGVDPPELELHEDLLL